MPIPNLDVSLYPGLRKNSTTPPRISTRAGLVDGSRGGEPDPSPQGVIFQEDFSQQPDWHSAMHSTDRSQYADTHTIPEGWYAVRQDPTWAPSTGHDDRHEAIEILAENSDKARGGEGKSYVSWRDSYDPGWLRWNSDSILAKYFPEGYEQLYVEFYITFSDEWSMATSKLFRITSWSEEGDFFGYGGGRDNGPVFIYDYAHSEAYGVRNRLSFRGGPHGESYGMSNDDIPGFPRSLNGSGDVSMSFMNNFNGSSLSDGSKPFITNQLNPEESITELGRDPVHEELYGGEDHWTKLAFFVKMNSAPGEFDGVFMQWIDDELILENHNVRWNKENEQSKHVKWNVVAIGGNDNFRSYDNSERREEWYAIDDISIYSDIPNRPNFPSNFTVDSE